jgi:preprotein translocase subunit SecA
MFRPVLSALGLTVGIAAHENELEERRRAYQCNITYCTNKTLVFDYLRDRLALGSRRSRPRLLVRELLGPESEARNQPLLLRGLHFAIVDEADSVLIDEARTPLILSGIDDDPADQQIYAAAIDFARILSEGDDFIVHRQERTVGLTSSGQMRLAELAADSAGLWEIRRAREELGHQALRAIHLLKRDKDYIISDGKICIVDEYTGRVLPDRTWEGGLHQMIEAKEDCNITKPHRTLSRITFQRFFKRYLHLCGMTGTAVETAGELRAVYGCPSCPSKQIGPGAAGIWGPAFLRTLTRNEAPL